MNRYLKLTFCILITLLVGSISGIATTTSIDTWFVLLIKPSFNPPNYLFGAVWTTLYVLMGISFYLILKAPKSKLRTNAVAIFCVQLFLNFWWSFLFFKFQLIGIALIEIGLIWLSILAMIYTFQKINKTAAYLQIPYLLWVSFASILNASFWCLNK